MSEPLIKDYTIGWICALQEEYEAACRMLDGEFVGTETNEVNDNNTYAEASAGLSPLQVLISVNCKLASRGL